MALDYEGREAKSRLQGPGVGLIIVGVFYILSGVIFAFMGFAMNSAVESPDFKLKMQEAMEKAKRDNPRLTKQQEKELRENLSKMENVFASFGPIGGIWGVLQGLQGVVVICGAITMLNFKSSVTSMIGAVTAAIPCAICCWPLGLPFGIWGVVALNHPEVKAAFREASSDRF